MQNIYFTFVKSLHTYSSVCSLGTELGRNEIEIVNFTFRQKIVQRHHADVAVLVEECQTRDKKL